MILAIVLAAASYAPQLQTQAAALFRAGELRFHKDDASGALVLFQASYRLVPAPPLWVDIAQCLRRLGRSGEAADAYRQFLESRSGGKRLRAEVFEALDELESPPRLTPPQPDAAVRQSSMALFQRARARYQAGDFSGALEGFRAVLAAEKRPELHANIAQCLRKLDRPEDAVMAYHEFLQASPGPRELRLEVWEALDETLSELDERLYRLAESAAQLERVAGRLDVDPARRQAAAMTARDIRQVLVEMDATLSRLFAIRHL